ncbi:MAG: hypothetical protein J0M12_03490 [Deltaproteobacteria bacterium]|nr:hypothetical protein [Deltaproteobacteria bacterium]
MLPVYKVASSLTFEKLFELPQNPIEYDWFGERVKNPASFVVAVDPDRMYLGAHVEASPWYDPAHTMGQYVEGLWNKDCAELFISSSTSPVYQEFNLGPTGAWWSCSFSKYRKRDSAFTPPQGVTTYSQIGSANWRAALAIPLNQFALPLDLEDTSRANVSFVVGKAKRQYLTWANIQQREPDFHRAEDFENIDLISHL